MNDDWRLQIDLDDAGVSGQISDHLRAAELEHDLETAFDQRVIVSHEGETIYLYAGDRAQLGKAQRVVQGQLDQKGWNAKFELRHWHEVAEDWEDPEAVESADEVPPSTEPGELAEFEVRVEFPSHREAKEFAEKLEAEGLQPVRRWKYMVVGAADEDAANELADRIRDEAPADSKVIAEGSLAAAWRERPPSPFWWLGGLADG
ncbi:MAG: hypothetical protein JST53_16875 [Actinobacteria bacterium]|nr:hypothetical protein [Actinomycetota bacterium]